MSRYLILFGAAAALISATGCSQKAPANVAATVNSKAITFDELEKNYQTQVGANTEGTSEDQVQIQKLELLRTLIDGEIMLQRAEKLNLMASDSDVTTKLNELKSPLTKEEFDKQLAARKMTLEDLKTQLRRQLSIDKLLNKEITSKISITDADVANFYQSNKSNFNFAEPQIRMAQILVTPFQGEVRNLKNSKAQGEAQARAKAEDILGRLKKNEDFAMLAQNFSEDPQFAPNGGDLGYVPESSLEKASPELRKLVASLPPGGVSNILHSQEGYRILKVISKEAAGQRELTDPRVQQTIREILINRKDQLLKQAYYEVARNEAKVINYVARQVTDNAGKK